MRYILDTSVAIQLRDGDAAVAKKVSRLEGELCLSILSRVELEGGVLRRPEDDPVRRQRLDILLAALPCLPFEDVDADHYRQIIEAAGFSRPRIIDRMIAAQALSIGGTVVTLNVRDFNDVPGLSVLAW